jgi:hypothetical protein
MKQRVVFTLCTRFTGRDRACFWVCASALWSCHQRRRALGRSWHRAWGHAQAGGAGADSTSRWWGGRPLGACASCMRPLVESLHRAAHMMAPLVGTCLQGTRPQGTCPQGTCPQGTCPQGLPHARNPRAPQFGRIRALAASRLKRRPCPPAQIFEYFATHHRDGNRFMDARDVVRALVPTYPPYHSEVSAGICAALHAAARQRFQEASQSFRRCPAPLPACDPIPGFRVRVPEAAAVSACAMSIGAFAAPATVAEMLAMLCTPLPTSFARGFDPGLHPRGFDPGSQAEFDPGV